jgi:hypothetical protein
MNHYERYYALCKAQMIPTCVREAKGDFQKLLMWETLLDCMGIQIFGMCDEARARGVDPTVEASPVIAKIVREYNGVHELVEAYRATHPEVRNEELQPLSS